LYTPRSNILFANCYGSKARPTSALFSSVAWAPPAITFIGMAASGIPAIANPYDASFNNDLGVEDIEEPRSPAEENNIFLGWNIPKS
jgi:hypothetical protein